MESFSKWLQESSNGKGHTIQDADDGGVVVFDKKGQLVVGFGSTEEALEDYPKAKKVKGLFKWETYNESVIAEDHFKVGDTVKTPKGDGTVRKIDGEGEDEVYHVEVDTDVVKFKPSELKESFLGEGSQKVELHTFKKTKDAVDYVLKNLPEKEHGRMKGDLSSKDVAKFGNVLIIVDDYGILDDKKFVYPR